MEKILKNYKGSLILVSHDKTLCQNVCDTQLIFKDKTIVRQN